MRKRRVASSRRRHNSSVLRPDPSSESQSQGESASSAILHLVATLNTLELGSTENGCHGLHSSGTLLLWLWELTYLELTSDFARLGTPS